MGASGLKDRKLGPFQGGGAACPDLLVGCTLGWSAHTTAEFMCLGETWTSPWAQHSRSGTGCPHPRWTPRT